METIVDTALRKTTTVALSGLRQCKAVLCGVTGRSRLPFWCRRERAFANLRYLALDIPPVMRKGRNPFTGSLRILALILETDPDGVIAHLVELRLFDSSDELFECSSILTSLYYWLAKLHRSRVTRLDGDPCTSNRSVASVDKFVGPSREAYPAIWIAPEIVTEWIGLTQIIGDGPIAERLDRNVFVARVTFEQETRQRSALENYKLSTETARVEIDETTARQLTTPEPIHEPEPVPLDALPVAARLFIAAASQSSVY